MEVVVAIHECKAFHESDDGFLYRQRIKLIIGHTSVERWTLYRRDRMTA